MGTNYYGRIIPTKKRKLELCSIINTDNWDKIIEEVHTTFDSFKPTSMDDIITGVVHLGKRSGGWKFLWDPNIYVIRNGHSEKEEIEPGHYRYNWIEEPDSYYYIYPLSKEGIWNFIHLPNVEIYDEYGEKQDKKEFFDMAVNWTTWQGKEAWDGKSYQKWEESQGNSPWHSNGNDSYIQALRKCGFNIEWPYTDFYSDGLRFSTNTDFS